jgi:predicted anti-sigma-YlaC factor YlaD
MECDRVRMAVSARIDGEDPGLPGDALEAHLAGCAACRGWQQRAYGVTRRARLCGSFLDRDLTPRVLAAIPPSPAGRGRRLAQRSGLITVALAQLAITVPLLIFGHDHDAGAHAAHELGSFDLALAIAFAVGAIRPALSAGLAWPCGVAAAGLAGTALADMIGGQTLGADEVQHLIALAGAALLFWQARTAGAGTAGPAIAHFHPQAGPGPGADAATPTAVLRLERPPEPPGGTDAARTTAPDIAARDIAARAVAAPPAAAARPDSASRDESGPGKDKDSDGAEAVA